jgi:hypothetical protein
MEQESASIARSLTLSLKKKLAYRENDQKQQDEAVMLPAEVQFSFLGGLAEDFGLGFHVLSLHCNFLGRLHILQLHLAEFEYESNMDS